MLPIIKWPGGKRRILQHLRQHLPLKYGTYHEPMVGGGALFFDLEPERGHISDSNNSLINFYKTIADDPEAVIVELQRLKEAYEGSRKKEKFYYQQRNRFNLLSASNGQLAALFLFLNRTCFNGLWRENMNGQMNVSFGNYKKPSFPLVADIFKASALLRRTIINRSDFASILDAAHRGDLVYLDPPYIPHKGNFTTYTAGGFGLEDHIRLSNVIGNLTDRGVFVILSNSDTLLTREIYNCSPHYSRSWELACVQIMAPRSINRDGEGRKSIKELIITNFNFLK